jgi:large subunit ribosomal protein L15
MVLKRTKKRRKMSRMRGTGTHGGGARKKRKKSGHRGGAGMAGSGKRADQKKTLVTALYGHKYFGKQGITSRKTQKDKRKRINLDDIELNIESYIKRGVAKKNSGGFEINLEKYKVLGGSENYVLKNKFFIKAKDASESAIEKIKKAGGKIDVLKAAEAAQEKKEEIEEKKQTADNKS